MMNSVCMSDTSPHQKPPLKVSYFHTYFGPRGPVPNQLRLGLDDLVRAFGDDTLAATSGLGKFQDNTLMQIEPRFHRTHLTISQLEFAAPDSLWLYEFCTSQGFLHHSELWQDPFWGSAWNTVPKLLQERIRQGHMYLLITSLPEDSDVRSMTAITQALKTAGAPMAFTYLCTSGMMRQQAKDEYKRITGCEIRTVPYFEALTLHEDRIGGRQARKSLSMGDSPPSKKFLMLNRRIDGCPHRVAIFLELLRRNLITDGHISMTWQDLTDPSKTFRDRIREIRRFPETPQREELLQYGAKQFAEGPGPLPLKLDVEFKSNFHRHIETTDHYSKSIASYFDDSYFSIVPECHFISGGPQDVEAPSMISEKTFFAMLNLHPFLIVGEPHTLARLKEYGYQTFSSWWDESYDEIEDPTLRIQAVANLAQELAQKPHSEWVKLTRDMEPTLSHNREHMRVRVDASIDRLALGASRQRARRDSQTKA